MTLHFDDMPSLLQPHFKGGTGAAETRIFSDEMGRILRLTLPAGASIGLHTHTDSCEVMYFLSGSGICIDDGVEVPVSPGLCHYCPRGHSHSVLNTGTEPLVILGIVPHMPPAGGEAL